MAMLQQSDESADKPGIRGFLNRNPTVVGGAMLAVVAVAVFVAFRPEPGPNAYYTVDDGATFFVDSYKIAPFEKDGKEAAQAMVYSCDGVEKFVGYMVKYPPEVKGRLEQALKKGTLNGPMPPALVKKPGPTNEWVMQGAAAKISPAALAKSGGRLPPKPADEVMNVKCKGTGTPKLLTPE